MKLPEPLEKIKDMKYAKWIGLATTLLLDFLLMAFALFFMDPYTGYYILMIGLVAISFATLYIFGWREGKQMVIVGIGFIPISNQENSGSDNSGQSIIDKSN